MFGAIADFFGIILNFLYNLVQNYGLAIILFSILLKLVMLPITIKQQKTMKKTASLQGELNKLKEKYKNNQEQLSKETMELYRREKVSPLSGCLGTILTLLIFLSVFYLVSQPITYMKKTANLPYYNNEIVADIDQTENSIIENEVVQSDIVNETAITNEIADINNSKNITVKEYYIGKLKEDNIKASNYAEIQIIEKYGNEDSRVSLNMNFLGLNLSQVPMQNISNIKVLIIPVLYVITTFVNILITTKMSKTKEQIEKEKKLKEEKKNKEKDGENSEQDEMQDIQQMTSSMNYMMPIMSIAIAIIAPLGLSLYWLISNLLQLIERVILNSIDKKEKQEEA